MSAAVSELLDFSRAIHPESLERMALRPLITRLASASIDLRVPDDLSLVAEPRKLERVLRALLALGAVGVDGTTVGAEVHLEVVLARAPSDTNAIALASALAAQQGGRIDVRGASFTLCMLLEEVVASHQALAEARGAKLVLAPLTARIAAQAEARFDAQPLRQILVNLLQNAIDVSPPGSEIDLRIVGTTVHIEDRGPGLDPAAAAKLFTSGFTTKPGGNGIGLVVARALAERLGGTLALQPREGGGCRATLKLPNDSPWQTVPR